MELNYYRLLFEPFATLAVMMLVMWQPKHPSMFGRHKKAGRK